MSQLGLGIDPIVRNPRTGERYIATCSADWIARLDAWRDDLHAWERRLAPILNRASRRGQWTLYHAAKRASYAHRLPCPMPEGHVMFERDSSFERV